MSPPRHDDNEDEATWPQRDRRVNAAGLSFTLQMVLTIVGVVLAAYGASWQAQQSQREAQAEMRSDIRNINTLMLAKTENEQTQRELDKVTREALKSTVETTQRELRLLQIEFQNFRQSMSTIQGRR